MRRRTPHFLSDGLQMRGKGRGVGAIALPGWPGRFEGPGGEVLGVRGRAQHATKIGMDARQLLRVYAIPIRWHCRTDPAVVEVSRVASHDAIYGDAHHLSHVLSSSGTIAGY